MPFSGLGFPLWHQKWCHFEYLLTYSQWEVTKLRVFFKNFSSHLFGLGEVVLVEIIKKISWYSVAVLESVYCPFTYSMFESHFVTPSLIPSGKGIFLSSFQKNSAHLTHIWKPFCQPIRRGFLLQFLTATFAAEKRHDLWKNSPHPYTATFGAEKRHIFRNFFKKCSHPSTARFWAKNGSTFSKKFS